MPDPIWKRVARSKLAMGATAVVVSTIYVWFRASSGWYAHDDGQLGQCAERILNGELPHRDFDEMYTGALSYLNAFSFQLFGIRSIAMRWIALPFLAMFAAASYSLASRVTAPRVAALITLLCSALTMPVYSAGMPSWYNLFFAVGGMAAIARYIDSNRAGWLLIAGLAGGLSIIFKVTGVYFVAAGLIYLVFHEVTSVNDEHIAQSASSAAETRRERRWLFPLSTTLFLMVFGCTGFLFIRAEDPLASFVHFAVPLLALAAFSIWLQWQATGIQAGFASRWWTLLRTGFPFLLGVMLPLFLLVGFYAAKGALSDLYQGVIVTPGLRLDNAASPFPNPVTLLFAAPAALFILNSVFRKRAGITMRELAIAAVFVLLLALSGMALPQFIVLLARNALPWIALSAVVVLLQANRLGLSRLRQREIFLMLAVAILISLIQFPFSGPIYFYYAAATMVLLFVSLAASGQFPPREMSVGLLVSGLVFAVCFLNGPHPGANADAAGYPPQLRVGLPRCDLLISSQDAMLQQEMVRLIQAHSDTGSPIFAGPDMPNAYFLSARRNAGREIFDFFDPQARAYSSDLIETLQRQGIHLVVVNLRPSFSKPVSQQQMSALRAAYPNRETIYIQNAGKPVPSAIVMWRDARADK